MHVDGLHMYEYAFASLHVVKNTIVFSKLRTACVLWMQNCCFRVFLISRMQIKHVI